MRAGLVAPLAAVVTFCVLPALSQTNFQYQPYSTPDNEVLALSTQNSKVFDFNNDGLADVLAASPQTCTGNTCNSTASLYLYMNNGTGLAAPVTLPVTLQSGSLDDLLSEVTVSDFNGDGKLDIAALNASGGISILYGKGDGTFQAPVTIALPAAGSMGYAGLVEADFDVNNTQDLAAMTYTGKLTVLFNDGKGNFTQQTVTIDTPASDVETTQPTVGDFNADGRPDIAWIEQSYSYSSTNYVMSALNTAKGVFSAKHQAGSVPGSSYFIAMLSSADLDLDGKSDLVAWDTEIVEDCCSNVEVAALYSNGDGTFTDTTVDSTPAQNVGVADINGDGRPDVLVASYQGVQVYTGNGNRTFTNQGVYTSLPGGAGQLGFGFFTANDAVGFAAPAYDAYSENDPNDLYLVQNDNPQGNCAYPRSGEVNFCQATGSGNAVLVRGAARAQTQPVRHIELWANGKKVYQVFSDEFYARLNLPANTKITAVEVEANGVTHSTSVTPTPGLTCDAPASPGVNICTPTQGESVTSPVEFQAIGTAASGTVNHLELWIDGAKIGNYNGSSMDTTVPEPAGSHTATVIEVDSKGNYVKSTPVTYTVGGTAGGCSAPTSPGVHVCSPTQGSSVTSPVTFEAAGTGASGSVNHLELWIDGTKIGNYSGSTMDTQVSEPAGSHTATVVEVDSSGNYVKSSPVTYTVTGGSSGYVSWVFNAVQPLNGGEGNTPTVQEIGVEPNGNENYGQVLQIPNFAQGGIAANSHYVFAPDGQSAIYAISIGANGELTQAATTNTSAEGGQDSAFLDRTGQTVYTWTETSSFPEIVAWSIGANGALTKLNGVQLNTAEPANPQVSFLPNNQIAYWTGCGGSSTPASFGFRRASSGALTEFNPNMNYPAAPANSIYCPIGAAAADNTHVVIALEDLNNSNYGFYDTQLAVYTVASNGTLSTTNTTATMPEVGAQPNAYAFDSTGTWLALGDSSGLDLYKYTNGVLTHTDSLTLSGGVAQVNWDASGHLFLVGQPCCGGTAVYTVTSSGSLTPAPDNGTWGAGLNPGILETVQPIS